MPAKYERIANDLRQQIASGELQPGERVPSENSLIERYKVSIPTLRQALAVLRTEGLVEARHGKGTYVREPRRMVTRRNDRHQHEKDVVRQPENERRHSGSAEGDTGFQTDAFDFEAEYATVTADDRLATVFSVPVGTPLLRRSYHSRFQDEDSPLGTGYSYLVLDMINSNPKLLDPSCEPWPGGTMHQLSTVGIEVDRIVEEIYARLPSHSETEALNLLPGTAVFAIQKKMIDIADRVVEFSDFILPGDRHRMIYTTQLERWK